MLRVGQLLYGFCGGYFGRDSYGNKRVEGIGVDWVVVREINNGYVYLHTGKPELLMEYTVPEGDDYFSVLD